MTTLIKLVENIGHYLKIDISKDPFASFIAKHVRTDIHRFNTFTETFSQSYRLMLSEQPEITRLTNPIFLKSILYCTAQPAEHAWWTDELYNLFGTWTQYGLCDITPLEAEQLAPVLRTFLHDQQYETKRNEVVMSMVFLSKALWDALKPDILVCNMPHYEKPFSLDARVFHRHEPNLLGLKIDGIQHTYKMMFHTVALFHTPALLQFEKILKGAHNNALAWSIAFEEYSVSEDWTQLLPTFSRLALEPQDQDSWRFWHSFRECTKYNESGQELIAALAEAHPTMHQAFEGTWSLINTLESGDQRYARAASLSMPSKSPTVLEIPNNQESYFL